MTAAVAVVAADPSLAANAQALAAELALPLLEQESVAHTHEFAAVLELTRSALRLQPLGEKAPGPLLVDFLDPALGHRRRGGHNEPLGRALGLHKWPDLQVIDATAGLGRDSFIIADIGARVLMLERHPVVFALLRDGLDRGRLANDEWVAEVCSRLQLERADSEVALGENSSDAVYLDPMFPARRKSARVKKGMWIFQQLIEQAPDEGALLECALLAARKRVVVKRPARAEPLAGQAPGFSLPGKTVRYDVYVC